MSVLTKADLIEDVSRAIEVSRRDSKIVVESTFGGLVRALRAGDRIEIRGFGSFATRRRQARIGRNPKTGMRVEVPPKKVAFFKPSHELADAVNRSKASTTPQPSSIA